MLGDIVGSAFFALVAIYAAAGLFRYCGGDHTLNEAFWLHEGGGDSGGCGDGDGGDGGD